MDNKEPTLRIITPDYYWIHAQHARDNLEALALGVPESDNHHHLRFPSSHRMSGAISFELEGHKHYMNLAALARGTMGLNVQPEQIEEKGGVLYSVSAKIKLASTKPKRDYVRVLSVERQDGKNIHHDVNRYLIEQFEDVKIVLTPHNVSYESEKIHQFLDRKAQFTEEQHLKTIERISAIAHAAGYGGLAATEHFMREFQGPYGPMFSLERANKTGQIVVPIGRNGLMGYKQMAYSPKTEVLTFIGAIEELDIEAIETHVASAHSRNRHVVSSEDNESYVVWTDVKTEHVMGR